MNNALVFIALFVCFVTCQLNTRSTCNVCKTALQVNCTDPTTFCCAPCGDVGACLPIGSNCSTEAQCLIAPNCGGIRPPPEPTTCNICRGDKQVNCTGDLVCCAPCGDVGICVPSRNCTAPRLPCFAPPNCDSTPPPQACNTCPNREIKCPNGTQCCSPTGCGGAGVCGEVCTAIACRFENYSACDGGILPPPPVSECNCSNLPKPECAGNLTLVTHNCISVPSYTTDLATATLRTASTCRWVPVCAGKVCTRSLSCGTCQETLISALTVGTLNTEAAAIKACATSSIPSEIAKLCEPIRACGYVNGVCTRIPDLEMRYEGCLNHNETDPAPTPCRGFSNPCSCPYDSCQFISGTVTLPAIGSRAARTVRIGQCLPIALVQRVSEVLAPATTVSGAFAAAQTAATQTGTGSAGSSFTASISPITARPDVCTQSGVVSSEQKEAESSPDPTVVKIFRQGFDVNSIASKWAANINADNTLTGIVPRIVTMPTPEIKANGDVSLSTIVEVVSTGSLTTNQRDNLCEHLKESLATSLSKTVADFSGCTVTPMGSSSNKRSVEQSTSDNFVVDTTYTQSSSSSGSFLTVSLGLVSLLAVALFA